MMQVHLNCRILWVAALLSVVLHSVGATAQSYPTRPTTIVVSFAAGGFVDTVARIVGQKLSEQFGKPVIIENRPGAGGNLAHRQVAAAKPGNHVCFNIRYKFRPLIGDWMAKQLGV